MKKGRSKTRKTVFLILEILAVIVLGILIWQIQLRDSATSVTDESDWSELDSYYADAITYNGKEYPVRRKLSSVLFMGTDNYIDDAKQNKVEAFYNNNCADFLVILVFDHDRKTVTPFQINRDTMCDVPWLSVNGLVGGTVYQQITLAHTYGSGKDDSAKNTLNAVTSLLYDAPVKHYFAFTMDAVPIINDLVGGVTLTLEDDIPSLGEEYVAGATVTLRGSTALRFLRARDISVTESNLARMQHHRLYFSAFTEAARRAAEGSTDFGLNAYKAVERYLVTDLTAEAISGMADDLMEYEILPVVTPDGTYTLGEYAEFHPYEASLWECVRTTWCRSE